MSLSTRSTSTAIASPRTLPRAPATPPTPATPAVQTEQQPTPGSWRHPNLYEITKRQYATTFDERHIRSILMNGFCLVMSVVVPNFVPRVALLRFVQYVLFYGSYMTLGLIDARLQLADLMKLVPYSPWILGAIRLLFIINIGRALQPLLLSPDDVADIPLTPSQRAAVGLDPDVSTPQTLGSVASPNYITPPRYQKSTPRSSFGTPSERGSPLSGSPRALGMSTSHSPFSPSNGSPLFQKVVGGSATKYLAGSPSGGSSLFDSGSSATPGTPTPVTGKASVGLNSKWLYEKRRDSRGSSLFN